MHTVAPALLAPPLRSDPEAEAEQSKYQAMTELIAWKMRNGSLLTMCLQAIRESDGHVSGNPDVLLPGVRGEFIALARRAGLTKGHAHVLATSYFAKGTEVRQVRPSLAAEPESTDDDRADDQAPPDGAISAPTALYRWWDADDLLLYIGVSDHVFARTGDHSRDSSWMDFAARSSVTRYSSRPEALDAERDAIIAERPLFNQKHNNTPEARARLIEYLIGHGRTDLLMPAVSRA